VPISTSSSNFESNFNTQSVRDCLKILKIWQTTNFDMGFQKNDMRSRSEKVDCLEHDVFRRTCTYKLILSITQKFFSENRHTLTVCLQVNALLLQILEKNKFLFQKNEFLKVNNFVNKNFTYSDGRKICWRFIRGLNSHTHWIGQILHYRNNCVFRNNLIIS
jgi:hypothetical protein